MTAFIISIGYELISGTTLDTNAAYLSRELTALGWQVRGHQTVGDDRAAIAQALTLAMQRVDVVILSGGLGPTADDVTREGIADALGVALEPHPKAREQLAAFYQKLQRSITPSGHRQALIPLGCDVIPNPWGTAPGIMGAVGGCRFFALPGVPFELESIFQASVVSAIADQGGRRRSVSGVIHCYGRSEASIGEKIADLMTPGRTPVVGITASDTIVSVRVTAAGQDETAARTILDQDMKELRSRLGSCVFGEESDTLASVVAQLLIAKKQTIATAESCTGGLLAKWLTDVPGSSAYFLRGYVTYSNQSKTDLLDVPSDLLAREGAVCEPVAQRMAEVCRQESGADLSVSITGIAGPGGGEGAGQTDKPVGLVYIGLADKTDANVKRILFGPHLTREQIRERSARAALNIVRRRLQQM